MHVAKATAVIIGLSIMYRSVIQKLHTKGSSDENIMVSLWT